MATIRMQSTSFASVESQCHRFDSRLKPYLNLFFFFPQTPYCVGLLIELAGSYVYVCILLFLCTPYQRNGSKQLCGTEEVVVVAFIKNLILGLLMSLVYFVVLVACTSSSSSRLLVLVHGRYRQISYINIIIIHHTERTRAEIINDNNE